MTGEPRALACDHMHALMQSAFALLMAGPARMPTVSYESSVACKVHTLHDSSSVLTDMRGSMPRITR